VHRGHLPLDDLPQGDLQLVDGVDGYPGNAEEHPLAREFRQGGGSATEGDVHQFGQGILLLDSEFGYHLHASWVKIVSSAFFFLVPKLLGLLPECILMNCL
jgi:hypothetical protein